MAVCQLCHWVGAKRRRRRRARPPRNSSFIKENQISRQRSNNVKSARASQPYRLIFTRLRETGCAPTKCYVSMSAM